MSVHDVTLIMNWYDYASLVIIYVCGLWKIWELGVMACEWAERKIK